MNQPSTMTASAATSETPRADWLRAGVLAGFLATFVMTVVLVAAYAFASSLAAADGGILQRWFWALVNNPVAQQTADQVVLAIGANLAVGLALSLVYARIVEPRLSGPGWWKGTVFALVPWVFSLVVFLPLLGGGVLGLGIGAGVLPIIGNLILHLVYGAVLGAAYAEAADDWLDDTDVDRDSAAEAERGAAVGVAVGLVPGFIVGWLIAPTFGDLVGRGVTAIGCAFIGAAIGLAIGSFAGLERAQTHPRDPLARH
jgi:hypothetical protein